MNAPLRASGTGGVELSSSRFQNNTSQIEPKNNRDKSHQQKQLKNLENISGLTVKSAANTTAAGTPDINQELENEEMIKKFRAVQSNQKVENNLAQKSQKTLSTQGSWSNREEEWYYANKRLIFATQSGQAADTWIMKLNQTVKKCHTVNLHKLQQQKIRETLFNVD